MGVFLFCIVLVVVLLFVFSNAAKSREISVSDSPQTRARKHREALGGTSHGPEIYITELAAMSAFDSAKDLASRRSEILGVSHISWAIDNSIDKARIVEAFLDFVFLLLIEHNEAELAATVPELRKSWEGKHLAILLDDALKSQGKQSVAEALSLDEHVKQVMRNRNPE